eukprot:148216-Chlamydomonas_euryale.AAC.1
MQCGDSLGRRAPPQRRGGVRPSRIGGGEGVCATHLPPVGTVLPFVRNGTVPLPQNERREGGVRTVLDNNARG